jgi:hypothetical protein
MPSAIERSAALKTRTRRVADAFEFWNRKLHYYLGLYFLFFLWLFAFTGLLLNHSWKFTEFWPNRKISTIERQVQPPASGTDLQKAEGLMRQLGIQGEVEWPTARSAQDQLNFRVSRPGHTSEIKADLNHGRARIEVTEVNLWGVVRILHTFTGTRMNDAAGNQRDWILTTIWALSMDAVAIGLIFMVCSSFYMWYRLTAKRNFGFLALALGVFSCGFLVFGLRWIH